MQKYVSDSVVLFDIYVDSYIIIIMDTGMTEIYFMKIYSLFENTYFVWFEAYSFCHCEWCYETTLYRYFNILSNVVFLQLNLTY